jgi:ribA/ribD-fused uncharacterized protein
MTISSFTMEHSFLSNFYPCLIEFDGDIYPTLEHAYQAAKTHDPDERRKIREEERTGKAKQMGQRVTIREDWEQIKVKVMRELLKKKFENPQLRKLLLDTYPHDLIEGNNWRDTFWGVYKGQGKNMLGILLMQVRTELRGEGW